MARRPHPPSVYERYIEDFTPPKSYNFQNVQLLHADIVAAINKAAKSRSISPSQLKPSIVAKTAQLVAQKENPEILVSNLYRSQPRSSSQQRHFPGWAEGGMRDWRPCGPLRCCVLRYSYTGFSNRRGCFRLGRKEVSPLSFDERSRLQRFQAPGELNCPFLLFLIYESTSLRSFHSRSTPLLRSST